MGRFAAALEEGKLLESVRRLGVAVSGGADSVALLHLFADLWARSPPLFEAILVLHVHHGLRGEAADGDEDLARRHAVALGLGFASVRVDALREHEESGESIELAARRLRYDAFRRWAGELRLQAIATGHHLEDQAETVLYRALRGTGLRGLAGIPPKRRLERGSGRAVVIRPLLEWPRRELRAFLEERGIAYREDRSNADPSIPRNFLRGTLLPLAERHVHPGAIRSLARLGRLAREHMVGIRRLARAAFASARVGVDEQLVTLSVDALRRWPSIVAREAVHLALEAVRTAGEQPGPLLRSRDAQTLARWLAPGGPATGRIELAVRGEPLPLTIELRYAQILIARGSGEPHAPGPAVRLRADGAPVRFGAWELVAQEPGANGPVAAGEWLEERVDADRVASLGELWVRSRQPGDRFWPLGAPGHKKLKELFRERRIRPPDRAAVPLLAGDGEIVWVVGHRLGHPYRVESTTRRVLVLRARRLAAGGESLT